jgi:hypothetical protein
MTDTTRLYVCIYRGRSLLINATSSYLAQRIAAKQFNARKAWDVIVYLSDEPIATSSL